MSAGSTALNAAATTLDHAYQYADAGWPVIELRYRDKRPATAHGKDDATTDRSTINASFADNRANIGILTGPKSRLLILDMDTRNGGSESFAARSSAFTERCQRQPASTPVAVVSICISKFLRVPLA